MKKFVLIFGLAALILVSGCVELPKEVPKDFELKYSTGDCYEPLGRYDLSIDAYGNAIFEKEKVPAIEKTDFSLSEGEVLSLYQQIVLNNFFSLNEKYFDPNIIDGGCSSLTVKADGKEHTVSVANMQVASFDSIADAIEKILDSKISDWKKFPEQKTAWLSFQPMQCEQTPWEKWYAEGNIQFIKAPTEEELIHAYYSNVYQIEIIDAKKIPFEGVVCEACGICPQAYHFEAKVDSENKEKMIELGWKEIVE